ncbi:hypothetical protein DFH06DRAFT_1224277 [Mycena polygramma]|nr:hypothetical protein DFH06DRAFT_1224277 [Mycena polygramma]
MSTHSLLLALTLAIAVLLATGFAWQTFCKSPPPWLKQLDSLGRPRKQMLAGTAIVCGGSISGIVAARICADHFERVVIIDPEIQDSEKPKTRIMQYTAVHGFLALFVQGARRLWPNFDAEMKATGGRMPEADLQLHYSGVPIVAPYTEYSGKLPTTLVMSRPSSQRVLERLFLQHPTMAKTLVLRGTVRKMHASEDGASVATVTIRQLDGTFVTLDDAALVVDCTGTSQTGLKWLRAAGFKVPETIRAQYHGNIQYSCLTFDVPPSLASKLPIPARQRETAVVYLSVPHDDTLATFVMLLIGENNTMQLVVGDTSSGDLPRTAPEVVPFMTGFRGYIKPVPSWVLEVVGLLCEHGKPSVDVVKIPIQSFVRYHSLPPGILPSNFVAVGDSSMQLNPVHGQGMAKVILNGIALNHVLYSVKPGSFLLPRNFSALYFANAAPALKGLWDATRLHDYGSLKCGPMDGETRDTGRFVRWFENKLLSAGSRDEEVASAVWHVRHMLAADKSLFAPTVLWKVLLTRSLFPKARTSISISTI